MENELSLRSRIVKTIVQSFNSNTKLTERFSTENQGNDYLAEEEYHYPEFMKSELITMENFRMELLSLNMEYICQVREEAESGKSEEDGNAEDKSREAGSTEDGKSEEGSTEDKIAEDKNAEDKTAEDKNTEAGSDKEDDSEAEGKLLDKIGDRLEERWNQRKERLKPILSKQPHLIFRKKDELSVEELEERLAKSRRDCYILHFHGGGYVGSMRKAYRTMAGLYLEISKGANVLSVDYRVAPEHPFPAAVEDALEAYKWLLNQGIPSERIVFAGDSAGGGLSLALCHVLKSRWMPLPAGVITMSPWTDVTASGKSYTENEAIDPVFGGDRKALIFENPYVGDANPRDPRISPAFGDFSEFPPVLIQVGTDEMLYSDSEIVAEKIKVAGGKVRFTKYEGMFHVFQMAGKVMDESKRAWHEVGRFLDEVL